MSEAEHQVNEPLLAAIELFAAWATTGDLALTIALVNERMGNPALIAAGEVLAGSMAEADASSSVQAMLDEIAAVRSAMIPLLEAWQGLSRLNLGLGALATALLIELSDAWDVERIEVLRRIAETYV